MNNFLNSNERFETLKASTITLIKLMRLPKPPSSLNAAKIKKRNAY